jgi:hypothetical protein
MATYRPGKPTDPHVSTLPPVPDIGRNDAASRFLDRPDPWYGADPTATAGDRNVERHEAYRPEETAETEG